MENKKVEIRPYTLADWDSLLELQKLAFPSPFPVDQLWTIEQIASHIKVFSEGALAAFIEDKLVGSCTSLRTDEADIHNNWYTISDGGYIKNTHKVDGEFLYNVDICVNPAYRGKGIANLLYEFSKKYVKDNNLTAFLTASRVPNYHKHSTELTIVEYVEKVARKEIHDPVLFFMFKQELKYVSIIPDYIIDEESHNHAVLFDWRV
jgi:ribosomal protein S18 acetylase RimI-like enzyme